MSGERPKIQIENATSRSSGIVARSPSHESIEVSLLSLNALCPFARVPSPTHRLAVPNSSGGGGGSDGFGGSGSGVGDGDDCGTDLIKNFGALFKFLGSKSFSTSDIVSSSSLSGGGPGSYQLSLRKSSSEFDLVHSDAIFRIPSRSCSTRVFVGDVPSSSQLPSPQGRLGSFTPADLVRSVNKKVRQLYIRKRLSVAYKLTRSGLDVTLMPPPAPRSFLMGGGPSHPNPQIDNSSLSLLGLSSSTPNSVSGGGGGGSGSGPTGQVLATATAPTTSSSSTATSPNKNPQGQEKGEKALSAKELTLKDVERERGRPLSKLERNIFIFNWLHSLDDSFEPIE